MDNQAITELFDSEGNLIGALLSAEAWSTLKPLLPAGLKPTQEKPANPEPIADWETLKSFWDFPYPVDMDVACGTCGTSTADWSQDEPRRFRLTAAGLSGLVTFQCQTCQSKIIKKHFKDEIVVETHPQQDKNLNREGLYKTS